MNQDNNRGLRKEEGNRKPVNPIKEWRVWGLATLAPILMIIAMFALQSFALPAITFVSPTFSNASFIPNNWLFINATVDEPQNQTIIEFNSQNYTIYEPSLVLNLPFDEGSGATAYDNSMYGNNGILTNMNTTGNATSGWSDGKFGGALQFDGINDYVNITKIPLTSFTLSAWAYYIDGQPSGDYAGIESNLNGLSNQNRLLLKGTNEILWQFNSGQNVLANTSASMKNSWHHYSVTYDGITTKIYFDGIQLVQNSTYTLTSASNSMTIGWGSDVPTYYHFNGTIDEVRIYNRSLSAEEIARHYNMSFGRYYANFTNLTDGTYSYRVYAQNTTGDWNISEQRIITVDTVKPSVSFVSPTDTDNTYTIKNWTYINTTVTDANPNSTALIDFNRSLVGWWRFNKEAGENDTFARDWSTYGNNGTMKNMNPGIDNCTGNCSGWTSSGKFGNALQFDGVNDYVNAGNGASLNITDNLTLELWVKPTAFAAHISNQHRLMYAWNPYPDNGFYLRTSNTGVLWFAGYNSGVDAGIASSSILPVGSWTHIVVIYQNGTNGTKIYFNGVLDKTGTTGPIDSYSGATLYFNHGTAGADFAFNGTIDEVRIYNRALSEEEINASYNAELYRLYHNFTNLTEGTYTYTAYTQDLAGNVNQTETRTITMDQTQPFIGFVSPTDTNNSFVSRNWTYINTTISDSSPNSTALIDFNRSLVGWWRFNREAGENDTFVRDWSTWGNNGRMKYMNSGIDNCTGNCSGWTASGKFGYGMQFDGVDDYVNAENGENWNITGEMSIETWTKPAVARNGELVSRNWASNGSFILWMSSTGTVFQFRTKANDGTQDTILYSDISPSIDNWQHIAAVFSVSGGYKRIYINGVQHGNQSVSVPLNITSGNLYIGGTNYFSGSIDEVRIYNRALSPEEINASYNAGLYRLYHNFTDLTDGSYSYAAYAQDLAGNVNQTEIRTLTVDQTQPFVDFVSPTDNNNSFVSRNWTYLNTTIADSSPNSTALIDFNRSLVGWWRFNRETGENDTFVRDWSTYGNNGAANNTNLGTDNGTSGWTTAGRFGNAFMFDGMNDYVNMGDPSSGALDFGTDDFSISSWFYMRSLPNAWKSIASKGDSGSVGYGVEISSSNQVTCSIQASSGSNLHIGTAIPTIGSWHHVVCVFDRDKNFLVFLDGTLTTNYTSVANNSNSISTSAKFTIGSHDGSTWYFNGSIDDVQLYKRTLNWEEINASYNAGIYRLYHNFTGLVDGTYTYTAYAQDLTGNVNQTETRTLTVDMTQPFIAFVSPTDSDNAFVSRNWNYVNNSAYDADSITAFIDFNRSLVGWWRFNRETDENDTFVRDWSSWSNNGTMINMNPGIDNCTGNCSGLTASGKFGYGMKFDGMDDYVDVGNGAILNFTNNSFSVFAWVIFNNKTKSQYIVNGKVATGDSRWHLYVDSGNQMNVFLKSNDGTAVYAGSLAYSTNVWYHYGFTRDKSTGRLLQYRNGILTNNVSDITNNITSQGVFIGSSTGTSQFVNATIDEVRIWNRALSPEEINASYNAELYRLYHNFTNLTEGTYTYTAYAQDLAGNVNQTETRTLTIDTTPPQLNITSPINGTIYSTPQIYFNATCLNEPCPSIWLIYNADTILLTNATGTWTHENTSMPDGAYTARFFANDSVGNINSTNITFEVRTIWYPTMTLNKTVTMRGTTLKINGTIQDAQSTPLDCAACLNITWGTTVHSGLSVSSGSYNDTHTISSTDTNMTIILNVSSASKSGTNTTQLTVNPVYTIITNCTESVLNKGQPANCRASVKTIESSPVTSGITVNFTLSENQTFNFTTNTSPYTWNFTAPETAGTYTLSATVSDPFNNTGQNNTLTFKTRELNLSLVSDIKVLTNKLGQYQSSNIIFADTDTGYFKANITVQISVTDEEQHTQNDANLTITLIAPNSTTIRTDIGETAGGQYTYSINLEGYAPADSGQYMISVNATDNYTITGQQNMTFNVSYWTAEIWYNTSLSPYLKGEKVHFNITTYYNSTPQDAPDIETQLRDNNADPVKYRYYPENISAYSPGKYTGNFTTDDIPLGDYFLYAKIIENTDTLAEDKHSDITIGSDTQEPEFSDNKTYPSSGSSYAPENQFNITISDNSGTISSVLFEINSTNYTISAYRQINSIHYEYYTAKSLPAGIYTYRWHANDSSGNMNSTSPLQYIITKAQSSIILLLNSTNTDKTYEKGTLANITAAINISGKPLQLWTNFSGSLANIQNGTTALTNITNTSSLSVGTYIINATFAGDENYTSSSASHYLTVIDTTGPTITITEKISPLEYGSQQNITASVSDQSNISSVLISYGGANHTMLPAWWHAWTPIDAPSTLVSFTIYSNDSTGTWNHASDTFTMQDTTPPSIASYSIAPPAPLASDTITISANITDNYNISTVLATITKPSSGNITLALAASGSSTYTNTYQTQEDGNHTLFIYANDTEGNVANSTSYFTALKQGNITLLPSSYSATIPEGTTNTTTIIVNNTGDLNTTVNIYSASYQSSWLNYSETAFNLSSGQSRNITLNMTAPMETTPDVYTITVIANTTIGQDATVLYITVPDLKAPIINSVTYINISYGQQETIAVNATDNKQLDKCTINHNSTNITMPACTYTYTPAVIGNIAFTIYVNDTSGNVNQTTNSFTVADNIPPNITSHTVTPKAVITSNNVSMITTAADNYALNYTWVNITLPDQNSAILLLPANYTTSQSGRHNITFFANDSSGNRANATDYFIAEQAFALNGSIHNINQSGVPANITFYFPESVEIINNTQTTGNYTLSIPEYVYDIRLSFENRTELTLNYVNISDNRGKEITLDTPIVQGYLKTITINTTYTFRNATIILPYNSTSYTNENYLSIHKCSAWNFTREECSSSWQSYPNATQNKTDKRYHINANSFSAYAIKQDAYCGDATCSSGESCSSCSYDCGACSGGGGCIKGIDITLEDKTIYENIPTNITLTITNTGTCTLYDSHVSAAWTFGTAEISLGDMTSWSSRNVSLELNIPKEGEHGLSVNFSSQSYNADKKLSLSVAALASEKQLPPPGAKEQPTAGNTTKETPKNATLETENKSIQSKSSEKKASNKEIPSANPVNYMPVLVLVIAALAAVFVLFRRRFARTKETNY